MIEMVVCDVFWQVVKERLLDMLNREDEEESHGEDVVIESPVILNVILTPVEVLVFRSTA